MIRPHNPDSNHPRMGDFGPFVRVEDEKTGLIMVVPAEPPKNSFGFILPPVDYEENPHIHHSRSCPTCHYESPIGERNRHHSYWPRTPHRKDKRRERLENYPDAPNYRGGHAKDLRDVAFSISDEICVNWHAALHKEQRYPTIYDLPEIVTTKLALLQFDTYSDAVNLTARAASLGKIAKNGIIEDGEATLNVLDTQKDFIFPTLGYYTMTHVTEDELMDAPLPIIYDRETVTTELERAIESVR